MAISVDWGTSVITIQQADMILIQSTPTIVYQLDMDVFRLTLKDLEDDELGMPFPRTHNHNPPVSVSGAVLARVVEILAPYTISFEETGTPYRVNVVGANTNLGERVNLGAGEVSVSTSNSAGLQDLNSLQAASFGNEVSLDINSSFAGTTYPIGTGGNPVNNLADAYTIAESRGIHRIKIFSSMTLTGNDFSEGYIFEGTSATAVTLTIDPASEVSNCTFMNLTVQGTLDNANIVKECTVLDVLDINGFISRCAISGTITLGGNSQCTIMSCYSGIAGGGATPTVDMGGSGQPLVFRNYSGGVKIINRTGTDPVSIDLQSGQVIVDSTVTAGEITVRGVGKITDNSTGTATVIQELLTGENLNKSAFIDGAVYLDSASSQSGTAFPLGTAGKPVNNLADALTIVNDNGLHKIKLIGTFTATASDNLDGVSVIGGSGGSNTLDLDGCSTVDSDFEKLVLCGTLNGLSRITNCVIGVSAVCGLSDVEGRVKDSIINTADGVIQKATGEGTIFDNCSFIAAGFPQVALNANGKPFSLRNCTGNIIISNKTDIETDEIHMIAGELEVNATCTAGELRIEGGVRVTDNSNGTTVTTEGVVNPSSISDEVNALTVAKYMVLK